MQIDEIIKSDALTEAVHLGDQYWGGKYGKYCVCGKELTSTTSSDIWVSAVYDLFGKFISGTCIHGIFFPANVEDMKAKVNNRRLGDDSIRNSIGVKEVFMYIQVGLCPFCGSPIYQPETWAGTCPPSLYYVCHCDALMGLCLTNCNFSNYRFNKCRDMLE